MQQEAMDRVNDFSEKMLLHYAAPNKSLVVDVLQLDASNLDQLQTAMLSKYVLVLGQYLVMLQHNENLKNVEYLFLSSRFEYLLRTAKFARSGGVQGKTEKERKGWLLLNDPELEKVHQDMLVVEAEKMLISGMGKPNEGLLNALKKELSVRKDYTA